MLDLWSGSDVFGQDPRLLASESGPQAVRRHGFLFV